MVKLKHILCEGTEDHRVKRLAEARGYRHETYRGDTDDGNIFVYSRKERREHGISPLLLKKWRLSIHETTTPASFIFGHPKSWT